MSTSSQTIVSKYVTSYTELFPNEWKEFQKAMKEKLSNSTSDFGEVHGSDLIVRKLFEIPETLYTLLKLKLSVDDWAWFQSKEGGRWFASRYPQFRTSSKT